MTIQDQPTRIQSGMANTALRWLSLMVYSAAGHNWRITLAGNRQGEISLHVTHDAPLMIADRGIEVMAGEQVVICRQGGK